MKNELYEFIPEDVREKARISREIHSLLGPVQYRGALYVFTDSTEPITIAEANRMREALSGIAAPPVKERSTALFADALTDILNRQSLKEGLNPGTTFLAHEMGTMAERVSSKQYNPERLSEEEWMQQTFLRLADFPDTAKIIWLTYPLRTPHQSLKQMESLDRLDIFHGVNPHPKALVHMLEYEWQEKHPDFFAARPVIKLPK